MNPGRNDPCHCGSGKKLKKCCGIAPAPAPATPGQCAAEQVRQGLQFHTAGQLDQAQAIYQQVLRSFPHHFDALHLLGVIANQKGDYAGSVALIRQALHVAPRHADAWNNLGASFKKLGSSAEAADCYRHAIALQPDYAAAHYNLGEIHLDLGELSAAETCYRQALELQADYPEACCNLGLTLAKQDRPEEALAFYLRALELRPGFAAAFNNLGNLLLEQGKIDEAVDCFRQALALLPDYAEAYNNLGNALKDLGLYAEALDCYRHALELRPDYADAHSSLIFCLDLSNDADLAAQQAERRNWHAQQVVARGLVAQPHTRPATQRQSLRIGYVSADFRHHSAAAVFSQMLLYYDRSRFEVVCYSNHPREDAISARLRAAVTLWRNIYGMPDEQAAERIRDDAIDILVDLSSHTSGNRLLLFARKPAPIQVTAWGYSVGAGLPEIDYLFADPVHIPLPDRSFYRETVLDLPCHLSYLCLNEAPPVAALPAASNGQVTFGCFNRLAKVSEGALRLWAELLHALPLATLVLKAVDADSALQRQRINGVLNACGIATERVTLLGKSSWQDHMAAYGRIDIALDPFPHPGGVTCLEGLWMGVPVVTLNHPSIVGHASAAILHAVGLEDWIAQTREQYLAIAIAKSHELASLARLRKDLRALTAASPVGNPEIYVRAVENEYEKMWRRWCAQSTASSMETPNDEA